MIGAGLLLLVVTLLSNKIKETKGRSIVEVKEKSKSNSKKKINKYFVIYKLLSKNRLTNLMLENAKQSMELIKPGDLVTVVEDSVKSVLINLLVTAVTMVVLVFNVGDLYMLFLSGTIYFLVTSIYIKDKYLKKLKKLREAFSVFMLDVRHHFYSTGGDIAEAVYLATLDSEGIISGHGFKIFEVITSNDLDKALSIYNETVPDKYLKMFTGLCASLYQDDDRKIDGKSVFLGNLMSLKEELDFVITTDRGKDKIFATTTGISVLPLLILNFLKMFTVAQMPEATDYYSSLIGKMSVPIIFAVSLGTIFLFRVRKNPYEIKFTSSIINQDKILSKIMGNKVIKTLTDRIIEDNYSKFLKYQETIKRVSGTTNVIAFFFKRALYAIAGFVVINVVFVSVVFSTKSLQLTKTSDLTEISGYNKRQILYINEAVPRLMEELKGELYTVDELIPILRSEKYLVFEAQVTPIALIISNRLNIYATTFYHWYYFVISLLIGALMYFVPVVILSYKEKIIRRTMRDEVMQFQSIISMLMHLENMTIKVILEWLERYAIVFKVSIQEALVEIDLNEEKALEDLQVKEPYTHFKRLIQNLELSDKVGIEKAYDELVSERGTFIESRKKEVNSILSDDKALVGFFSLIPILVAVILYLAIPFVMQAAGITNIFKSMS